MKRTDRTNEMPRAKSPNILATANASRGEKRSAAAGFSSRVHLVTSEAADLFDQGCEHEDAGRFHEAMRSYRRAIEVAGPSPSWLFNLANVLYCLRRKIEAVDVYRQALTHDDQSHEAWNNLGVVLCELKQCDEAMRAFQRAISLAPWFADTLYNLADCLDERSEVETAQQYWHDYLRLDENSEWSDYARSRLR
jgi:tetratricopeptide (TPR) repeat protein